MNTKEGRLAGKATLLVFMFYCPLEGGAHSGEKPYLSSSFQEMPSETHAEACLLVELRSNPN